MSGITVLSYAIGSLAVNALISPTPSQDPNSLYTTINRNINSGNSSNFNLLSSTLTPTGFNSSNNNSTTAL
jgi:hypothetical protein